MLKKLFFVVLAASSQQLLCEVFSDCIECGSHLCNSCGDWTKQQS